MPRKTLLAAGLVLLAGCAERAKVLPAVSESTVYMPPAAQSPDVVHGKIGMDRVEFNGHLYVRWKEYGWAGGSTMMPALTMVHDPDCQAKDHDEKVQK